MKTALGRDRDDIYRRKSLLGRLKPELGRDQLGIRNEESGIVLDQIWNWE